ncbi:MAG: CYTH domain-containing protein [Candidatus Zambryskibacteria bacterium]|nr:CYTH domain-containing protein [Candidatus Zambryskibacteria bacterium]
MQTEIETKFLNIRPDNLRTILSDAGATLIHEERLMRRKTFDDFSGNLRKIGGWIRVRDEGDKVTLAYKQLNDRTLYGTKEISLDVSDFETACNFLLATGFDCKAYQETKRERWELDGVEVTIDTWPWIPPFVEIEGTLEEDLKAVARKLRLDWNTALYGSVEVAYQAMYDVTENEVDSWENITFSPVPDWLEVKRR